MYKRRSAERTGTVKLAPRRTQYEFETTMPLKGEPPRPKLSPYEFETTMPLEGASPGKFRSPYAIETSGPNPNVAVVNIPVLIVDTFQGPWHP